MWGESCVRKSRIAAHGDRGAVTAEFATILPVVTLLAALLLSLARTVTVAMDCQDAAAAVARELILVGEGESLQPAARKDAGTIAKAIAGSEVSVNIVRGEGLVKVTTHCPVFPGPLGVLPANVHGTATGVEQ